MTTTDARKRRHERDMADAHATARERDAKARAGHPIEWFVFDETQTFTREHLTEWQHAYLAPANPRPGDVVQYLGHATTQARDAAWMLGALDGTGPRDRTHDDQETDTMTEPQTKTEWLADIAVESHRTNELLTEIRDRLPERVEVKVAPFEETDLTPYIEMINHHARALSEPADITDEPPVGSQVKDMGGDVWERREGGWALWWPERSGWVADLDGGELDPWQAVLQYAPLRPTTDADRERVGLPVEPAPADVDPDEALAKALFDFNGRGRHDDQWSDAGEGNREFWLDVARAAREHLMARETYTEEGGRILIGELAENRRRAEEAETDLADMTRQRDTLRDRVDELLRERQDFIRERGEWRAHHDALREDVYQEYINAREVRDHRTQAVFGAILNRDTERAES